MLSLRNRTTEDLIKAELPSLQLKHYLWDKRDQQIGRDASGNDTNLSRVELPDSGYEIGKD